MVLAGADPLSADSTPLTGDSCHGHKTCRMGQHAHWDGAPLGKVLQQIRPEPIVRLDVVANLCQLPDDHLGTLHSSQSDKAVGVVTPGAKHGGTHSNQVG